MSGVLSVFVNTSPHDARLHAEGAGDSREDGDDNLENGLKCFFCHSLIILGLHFRSSTVTSIPTCGGVTIFGGIPTFIQLLQSGGEVQRGREHVAGGAGTEFHALDILLHVVLLWRIHQTAVLDADGEDGEVSNLHVLALQE